MIPIHRMKVYMEKTECERIVRSTKTHNNGEKEAGLVVIQIGRGS